MTKQLTRIKLRPCYYWGTTKYKPIYVKKCCKQEYSNQALSWYNFNPKGIIIFSYNDKQIVFLTCMRNNNVKL